MITLADIPNDILAAIKEHAVACYPSECCGVLFSRENSPLMFMACRNVEDAPEHGFRVGSADLEVIASLVRDRNRVAVIYHSHVDQPATFSERDKHFAKAWPLTLHLVFAVTKQGVIAQHAYTSLGACVDEPVMESA